MEWKLPLLRRAALRFLENANDAERKRFETFRSEEVRWLDDYALFIALKDFFDRSARERGRQCGAWNESWDRDIALRGEEAMVFWKKRLEAEISVNQAIQFFFFTQWRELRAAARERGIRIIGDMPIFAAPDSADVWANRGLFLLDGDGRPTAVSGVPPDYFASTGQLWGNPLYDWGALRRQGFRFWIDRIGAAGRLFDFIRMDHFRGFSSCWAIPAGDPTAESGTWVASPGAELFEALERELGQLPLIAEDLGVITPEVNALRERFGFPGMRILQFAFDRAEAGALNADNRFLPHNHRPDSVVYTGTHDNDTTVGWYARRTREERLFLDAYAPSGEPDVAWRFIRMALASVSPFAIIPLQDILGLGSEARMNAPGTTGEQNWTWRFEANALDESIAHRLRSLSALYGRIS
jgi:4-alpha-glucanotransferase